MSFIKLLTKYSHHQFELDGFGSFSEIIFSQLSENILKLNKGFAVTKEYVDDNTFLGVFESPYTKLIILYNSDGSFISKKEEIWK